MIQAQGIRVYSPPVETDDEQAAEHARVLAVSLASPALTEPRPSC